MNRPADRLQPGRIATALLSRWPVVLALGALGGSVGMLYSHIRPPVYQAEAVLAVSIDYGRTRPLELVVEDRVLDRVWQLLTSDQVLQATMEQLTEEERGSESWATLPSLREHLRLETRLADWHFIARDRDPQIAALMANVWSDVALASLDGALDHAWKALSIQGGRIDVLCFELQQPLTEQGLADCLVRGPNVDASQLDLLIQEVRASRGVLPALSYEKVRSATAPSAPVQWDRGPLVLFGAILGSMVAISFLAVASPQQSRTEPAAPPVPRRS